MLQTEFTWTWLIPITVGLISIRGFKKIKEREQKKRGELTWIKK